MRDFFFFLSKLKQSCDQHMIVVALSSSLRRPTNHSKCHANEGQQESKFKMSIRQEKKIKNNQIQYYKSSVILFSQTSETLLLQMAVLDEPDMLDPNNALDEDFKGSGSSNVKIVDSGSNVEICEETELMNFSRILCDAQQAALAVERAKGIKKKTYTGVSWTTAWH